MVPEQAQRERRQRRWDRVSWWYSLVLLAAVVGVVVTVAWSSGGGDGLTGVVKDAYTGKPVSNALVSTANATAHTDGDGSFSVDDPSPQAVEIQKQDYESTQVPVDDPNGNLEITLRPTRLEGVVKNKKTGKPIEGATVTIVGQNDKAINAVTDKDGHYTIDQMPPNARISVSWQGFTVDSREVGKNVEIDFEIKPDVLSGVVTDDAGQPVAGATVAVGNASTTTGADGAYRLGNIPDSGKISVKKVGFEAVSADIPDDLKYNATLKKFIVKGVYVTAGTAGADDAWQHILDLADTTEINAVVLDLKDSSGYVFYDTQVPQASEIGAKHVTYDLAARLKDMHDHHIYAIGRIVVFEDPILAQAKPDWAIHDLTTGGLWTTWNGLAWVNAHHREVWQYNIDLMTEAAKAGFDEIQLDYIRFPTDGDLDNADFGAEFASETKEDAVTAFLTQAHDALKPTGAYLGADIFGITLWNEGDSGIGQNARRIAPVVDVVCPMVYPSHFAPGEMGLDLPNDHPHDVILWSLQSGADLMGIPASEMRPWLQDFSYGDGISYGDAEVQAQIQAAGEAGAGGWMLWNAGNTYHEGALAPQ